MTIAWRCGGRKGGWAVSEQLRHLVVRLLADNGVATHYHTTARCPPPPPLLAPFGFARRSRPRCWVASTR
eukprot:CAMPEP_0172591722 /NCGR_PEP_ID=MMETSP1068-20121228/10563_1 /TAXON_ID=35684 /ORGANISM="Pseudopedinella elastica, Strain CCMP716" /LENGTH=69 /DNA_ID=CAMNT_0013388351 /DNA_START=105 /DNA_END=311 /DNA_ORIENTATION=-